MLTHNSLREDFFYSHLCPVASFVGEYALE